jgi:hypothetical protein
MTKKLGGDSADGLTKEPKKSQIPSARPIILLLFIRYPFFRGHILEYKKADDRLF